MTNISPLAPKTHPEMPVIDGVRLGSVEAGIKYKGRKDLAVLLFDKPASVAGVFTRSKCPSAPVEWCRQHLARGKAKVVVVNSGNANAFTGKNGVESVRQTAKVACDVFGCRKSEVFLASTGVIGEPLDASGFSNHLVKAQNAANKTKKPDQWNEMAKAIMTTDTYMKTATASFQVGDRIYHINGMAKGAGMIQPDMATMLSFVVTDFPLASQLLQQILSKKIDKSFNSISVDSDTSTSDTVLLFSALNGRKAIRDKNAGGVRAFKKALEQVLHELAMLVVRDGEGASKHIEINVKGAISKKSAKVIGFAIANSPLIKTAIAGEDANWGRVVMAVGKAGEPAERDRLEIKFGDLCVAKNGERVPDYSESEASKIMKNDFIKISVDVGVGKASATVWSCDLTADYIAINADYRS